MSTTKTTAKAPVKTSDRKRPNKAFIAQMAQFRGFMTGNEKTQLATLNVKNVMQKVNNRAMSDDVNDNFIGKQNEKLQKLMKQFVKEVQAVISEK
jgi:hypothetical protein